MFLFREPFFPAGRLVVVPIAVPISIAVASVAVSAIAGLADNRTIEDKRHVVELAAAVNLLELGQHAAVELAYAYHEDGEVGHAVGDGGIGDDAHRYVIDEDVVVTGAELGNEFFEAFAQQQLGWVRGQRAGRDGVEVVAQGVLLDYLVDGGLAGEVRGHPFHVAFAVDVATQGTLADIEVDEDDFLLGLGKAGGQVGGHVGLAGTGTERTEGDDLHVLGLDTHEVHVGTDDAEGFGYHVAALNTDYNLVLAVYLLGLFVGVLGDFAQERYAGGILDVLAVADAGVEEEQGQQDDERQGGSLHDSTHDDGTAIGGYGGVATTGGVEHTGIVLGSGLGQGIFFTLVEQVEVELFLDAVLAVDGELLALLLRDVGDAVAGFAHHVAGFLEFGLDAHNVVVHRTDDVLTQGVEALVELLHHRVLAAAALDELVAFQLGGVVDENLALDVHVDTGVRRDELGSLGRVGEVVADVAGHTHLHLQLTALAGVLFLLRHGHAGGRTDIEHVVVDLKVFDLGFHFVELLGDFHQAFVDEVGGVDGHLVLVLDALFVVDGDEGVEHVLGTHGGEVTQGGVEHSGIVVGLAHAEVAQELAGGLVDALLTDVDGAAIPFVGVVEGGGNHHDAGRGLDGIAQVDQQDLAVVLLEMREVHLGSVDGGDLQGCGQAIVVHKADLHRGLGVEFLLAEAVHHHVADVGMEAGHDVTHQLVRLELQNLVRDVGEGSGLEAVQPVVTHLATGTLNHDRSRAGIVVGGLGVLVPGVASEEGDGQHEPIPLG